MAHFSISGLRWIPNWRMANGGQSYVVPFARRYPATVVFHGEEPFSYGHYGIHLGQADVLTFLGDPDARIVGHFLDCRAGSATEGMTETVGWQSDSRHALYIPPGVAHAFDHLEGVHTLNTYECFLPAPGHLEDSAWRPDSDVINVPMTATAAEAPRVKPNTEAASSRWYHLLGAQQERSIRSNTSEYPMTMDVRFDDGAAARVKLRKKESTGRQVMPEWEPLGGIDGLGWRAHPVLWSGQQSGFVPLTDPVPMYVIDHGTELYSHDAYGIHLGQEDRLTFLGSPSARVTVRFVDCREGSPTLHHQHTHTFAPSALRYLTIPPGVAHAFEHLESVFTVNRPRSFVYVAGGGTDQGNGADVIDWPLAQRPFPVLTPLTHPADEHYYDERVSQQRAMMAQPAQTATPAVLLVDDGHGRQLRVALRKKTAV